MNKIFALLIASLIFSACTKKEDSSPAQGMTRAQQEAFVENLGPQAKSAKNIDPVTMLNTNSYTQRGLRFDRFDKSTLRLKGIGAAPAVIVLGQHGLSNLPILQPMNLDVSRIGAGGIDRNLGNRFSKGIDVHVIAKADGSGAALLGTPTGLESILPNGYTQKSETVWFIAVVHGEILRFRDAGNGECIYLTKPLSEKDYRFTKGNRSVTYVMMDGLVPVKAAKATLEIVFYSDPELPQGSALSFKTYRNGFEIYTYYPLAGLGQRQQQQFQFDVPVESTSGKGPDPISFSFSGFLMNSSSSASFTAAVKGWRLYTNY